MRYTLTEEETESKMKPGLLLQGREQIASNVCFFVVMMVRATGIDQAREDNLRMRWEMQNVAQV